MEIKTKWREIQTHFAPSQMLITKEEFHMIGAMRRGQRGRKLSEEDIISVVVLQIECFGNDDRDRKL